MRQTPQAEPYFYDTHGFCKDGQHFTNWPPYHPALTSGERFITLDSGGGLIVTTGHWLSQAQWKDQCILRFSPEARLVLDTTQRILHP